MSYEKIKARHESTLFIDWAKEFDPEWQPSSLSNAEQCHIDRGELLALVETGMSAYSDLLMNSAREIEKLQAILDKP